MNAKGYVFAVPYAPRTDACPMSAADLLNHLLNFVAPAFWTAALLALSARLVVPGPPRVAWPWRLALDAGVGVLVLVLGLVLTGHDGAMATWIALVLAMATTEWCLRRAWR
ncbi:hypothetical protein DFQ15_10323 [Xylophilus ampelinus]|uniref:Uncharacterized protein n=2 Tax=Burkholderiales genera incertae sedis TaxID=224471 RepID=A0A318SJ60_9BURK|nr:hypothetical protein DFQ15_10323 [Xylophilus ampelinus]